MAGPDKSQSGPNQSQQRVLFEFTTLGQQVRVSAIDEATGTEVVVICPPQLGQSQMQRMALQKLRHKMGLPPETPPAAPRPGKWA
jgi:hypothetical protein